MRKGDVMILEEYKRFDAEYFLKGRKSRRKEIKRLEEELEALSAMPAVENRTGVRSSMPSDPTSVLAEKEMAIKSRLDDLLFCEKAYEVVMHRLTEDERKLIKGFFEPKMPIWKFVHKWEHEHYMGTTSVYKERRKALDRFSEEIKKEWGV